ncbi:MAG: DUF1570 domain-containing protein [Planctomycetia bacterium]|nr:DUF1570 domain-containing protein [Planctomycetia bacterium]
MSHAAAQTKTTPAAADDGTVPVLRADPSELGLKIPDAEPIAGAGRRVLVKSDDDELVVAKVQVEVGSSFVVILPDGKIAVVKKDEATITERPFVGIEQKYLADKLQKKFPGYEVQSTKHFIYVYNTSALFYKGTSRILESLYPGLMTYCKARKLTVEDPPYPLVVVMFRTRKEWEDYMHGMFAGSSVAAFYDGATNRVLMYEQSDLGEDAPEYALKQIISTVAHEGVHQVLHNIGVQQRLSRWPMWISEGLPEYFAPTSVSKGLTWKGAGQVNDLRMKTIDTLLKRGPRKSIQQSTKESSNTTVEAIVTATELDADGYAWSWALAHFLGEKKREMFQKYLADIATSVPMERPNAADQKRLFVKHFGSEFAKMDTDLMKHLKNLPYVDPIENMTHYVVMMRYPQGPRTMRAYAITLSEKQVKETREELVAKLTADEQNVAVFEVRKAKSRTEAMSLAQGWMTSR